MEIPSFEFHRWYYLKYSGKNHILYLLYNLWNKRIFFFFRRAYNIYRSEFFFLLFAAAQLPESKYAAFPPSFIRLNSAITNCKLAPPCRRELHNHLLISSVFYQSSSFFHYRNKFFASM